MANPFCTPVRHSTLALWMGQHTRVGNILQKTEVKKAMKKRNPNDIKHHLKQMNEDIRHEIIESKKVCIELILLSLL